jgi:hypothetical protein
VFSGIDRTICSNLRRVQAAFKRQRIGPHHFQGSTGYGHGDLGREALDNVSSSRWRLPLQGPHEQSTQCPGGFITITHTLQQPPRWPCLCWVHVLSRHVGQGDPDAVGSTCDTPPASNGSHRG